ncbi:MAG: hypothetical protein H0T62_12510 [Parachlamydiaceae bacterium]|nr:hypothetical protein [Parachlamydiaceae bacterium]
MSFAHYKEERESQQEPVDLIIGRGTGHRTPLNNQRAVCMDDDRYLIKSYKPFMADINSKENPDIIASVTVPENMDCFPDASVNDIYFERVYPTHIQTDLYAYFSVARILKKNGTFFAEFNNPIDDLKKTVIDIMNEIFKKFNIPLNASPCNDNDRSGLMPEPGIKCVKFDDFDPAPFRSDNNKLLKIVNCKLKSLKMQRGVRIYI